MNFGKGRRSKVHVEMSLLSKFQEEARQEGIKQRNMEVKFGNQLYDMIKANQNTPEQKRCSHVVYSNVRKHDKENSGCYTDVSYCHYCYKIDKGNDFY